MLAQAYTCSHGSHPRIDGQSRAGRWPHAVMLSSHGRHSRRSHHGRRAEVSTAVLRDDVISARRRDGVELVGVV